MKKWVFILGILISGILFFIGGSLVGYSIYDKQIEKLESEKENPKRKPSSIEKTMSPIIGRVVDRQVGKLKTKTRVPTPSALQKARGYRSKIGI